MKYLILYNSDNGIIKFSSSLNGAENNFNAIVKDIPQGKRPLSINIENEEVILADEAVEENYEQRISALEQQVDALLAVYEGEKTE